MNQFYFDAIYAAYPNAVTINSDCIVFDSDNNVINTDKDVVSNKILELKAEYDANEYQRQRAAEYPSWQDQLDKIYHEGVDAWKAEIKVIKDKYPKS